MKNEEHLLPLKKGSKLALFGSGASRTVKGGTGSGDVNERRSISIYEGLKDAGFEIMTEKWLHEYEEEYKGKRLEWKEAILEKTKSGTDFFTAYSTSPFHVRQDRKFILSMRMRQFSSLPGMQGKGRTDGQKKEIIF